MNISGQHIAYFSATHTTRNLVRRIGEKINCPIIKEYNIAGSAKWESTPVKVKASELLIVGVPSYFGRVPSLVVPYIEQFKGDNSPAVIICSYGNRDFEDTLLELKDILSANGFKVIAAGGFVPTHSIFPQVASNRPDVRDLGEQEDFAKHCATLLRTLENENDALGLQVRGNHPYRETGKIPFVPTGNRKCDECGTCVKLCPVQAIPEDKPRKTDKNKCINCGRCITVCPQDARSYGGLIYKIATHKFVGKNQTRQPNVMSYIEL